MTIDFELKYFKFMQGWSKENFLGGQNPSWLSKFY